MNVVQGNDINYFHNQGPLYFCQLSSKIALFSGKRIIRSPENQTKRPLNREGWMVLRYN